MKKFIWIITLLLPLSLLHSQSDPQWYLLNSDDSSLYDSDTTKLLVRSHLPPYAINTNTNNDDIFAITHDGNFVTTRGSDTPLVFNPFYSPDSSYSFEFDGHVKHLYWSDKYDNPRPPRFISVEPSGMNLNKVNSHEFNENPIFTHQAIIPTRDIMVAIKTDLLKDSGIYTLHYDQVTIGNTPQSIPGILEVSPSFNIFLPVNPAWIEYEVFTNSIKFKINTTQAPPILYFCLRVTEVASDLVSNGTDVNTLDFQLINLEIPHLNVSHSEEIRTAHDPNYIQLKGFCSCCNFVSYECQVENTAKQAPRSVSITLDLPISLIPSSLDIHNMHINGLLAEGHEFSKTIIGNTIEIDFNDINLRKRDFLGDEDSLRFKYGVINFNFCVRHNGSIKERDFEISQDGFYYKNSVIEGSTKFDTTEYTLDFRPGLSTDRLILTERVFKYITDDPDESCEVCEEECNYFCSFWNEISLYWLVGIAAGLGLFGLAVNTRRRRRKKPY